jgi:hypothetical protein
MMLSGLPVFPIQDLLPNNVSLKKKRTHAFISPYKFEIFDGDPSALPYTEPSETFATNPTKQNVSAIFFVFSLKNTP